MGKRGHREEERGPQEGNQRVCGDQEEEQFTALKWPLKGHRPPGTL